MTRYAAAKKNHGIPQKTSGKPELLAPAGSIDSFHAAVEAGADAVYLGLLDMNARLRAKNFSMKTLAFLVPYAHRRNVKVHVTLNTLVRQYELPSLLNTLYQLEQLGIDAVIVQDMGLVAIIKEHFPKLVMHASTQMAIHNSLGVQAARNMGLKRVILSRELSCAEITSIRHSKPKGMEIEVFVHGALCYSISGLCLASSFLGGMSGNRGRCTQVCRRRFDALEQSGFYFSPKDFCLIDHIAQLAHIGVDSIKIEGRMKSAHYVYTVVRAYRSVLDSPGKLAEAREILNRDFGREKTTFFFNSTSLPDIIVPTRPSGSGILLGSVAKILDSTIVLNDVFKGIQPGDRIRFHGQEGFEGDNAKVAAIQYSDTTTVLTLAQPTQMAKVGDIAFHVGSRSKDQHLWNKKRIEITPVRFKEKCPFTQHIQKQLSGKQPAPTIQPNDKLYLRFNNCEWLHHVPVNDYEGLILSPQLRDIHHLATDQTIRSQLARRLIIALPPFIAQNDIYAWDQAIVRLRQNGIHQWMCGNIGHRLFPFGANDRIFAGPEIWCMNRATQLALRNLGIARFTYSPEDDIPNLKVTPEAESFFIIFGCIPLFISRIAPASPQNGTLADAKGNEFFTYTHNKLFYLVGKQPVCLTQRRDTLHELGLRNFVLDFSFSPLQPDYLASIISLYNKKQRLEGSSLFNLKSGLK